MVSILRFGSLRVHGKRLAGLLLACCAVLFVASVIKVTVFHGPADFSFLLAVFFLCGAIKQKRWGASGCTMIGFASILILWFAAFTQSEWTRIRFGPFIIVDPPTKTRILIAMVGTLFVGFPLMLAGLLNNPDRQNE